VSSLGATIGILAGFTFALGWILASWRHEALRRRRETVVPRPRRPTAETVIDHMIFTALSDPTLWPQCEGRMFNGARCVRPDYHSGPHLAQSLTVPATTIAF